MDDLLESDWKASREAHALDFGSFALLAGELAEEMKRRGIPGDDEQMTAEIIKESLDCGASATNITIGASVPRDASQWFTTQAPDAEDYIRDVVYGGTEGFAYVRSLAEFVTPPEVSVIDASPFYIHNEISRTLMVWTTLPSGRRF